MDPVHDRGSMDPVHILMDPVHGGGPWTPGPCFVLSQLNIPCETYAKPYCYHCNRFLFSLSPCIFIIQICLASYFRSRNIS